MDKQIPSAVVPETSLPEIDGNALNEVDGQSAVPPNRVYELGGNSIRRRPSDRPLLVASEKNKSESKEEKTGSKTQEVVEMRASADYERKQTGPTRVVEAGNVTPLPLDATRETFIPESGSRPYDEMGLDDLEEEIARLRRKKERLQHLQSLEEQEEELRRQIGARRMNIYAVCTVFLRYTSSLWSTFMSCILMTTSGGTSAYTTTILTVHLGCDILTCRRRSSTRLYIYRWTCSAKVVVCNMLWCMQVSCIIRPGMF